MKKIINIISIIMASLIMMTAFCFAGCTPKENNSTPEPTAQPTSEPQIEDGTPTPAPVATPQQTGTNTETEAPTADISPEPTEEPTGTASELPEGDDINIETNGLPTRFTMPTELYGLSKAECEAWFEDACFVGDSVVLGWKNYNSLMLQNDPGFFGNTRFFCEGSYGFGHALEPVTEDSLHPRYGGEKRSIEDALQLMNAKKAIICFGVNDISIYGIDGTLDNCRELISRIYAKNPNIKLYFISAMYMYKGSEKPKLNNANLLLLNRGIAEICNELNIPFINIASHLIDEEGFVPDEYSSDHYVHQTYAAYDVWAEVLRSVAARELKGIAHPVFH